VERCHEIDCLLRRYAPEAHDEALGTGEDEGTFKAEDTLAALYVTEAGLAGRQDDEIRSLEIEAENLLGGHHTLVTSFPERGVHTGEDDAGAEHGVLDCNDRGFHRITIKG